MSWSEQPLRSAGRNRGPDGLPGVSRSEVDDRSFSTDGRWRNQGGLVLARVTALVASARPWTARIEQPKYWHASDRGGYVA